MKSRRRFVLSAIVVALALAAWRLRGSHDPGAGASFEPRKASPAAPRAVAPARDAQAAHVRDAAPKEEDLL